MTPALLKKTIAAILLFVLVAPPLLLIAPRPARAQVPVEIVASSAPTDIGTWIQSIITAVAAPTTAESTLGLDIKANILTPIARQIARMILQQITASIVNWINGANGTGQPSFVQNLSVHLQSVGDVAALALIGQITTGFGSPFGSAISLSLKTDYLQKTSVAGFFAANQCTLTTSSPNINAFLAGNWSQGGAAAWFSLTTQNQNNPFTLYQRAQSQLASNVGHAQTNRRQDLLQSGGFLSWCGGDTTSAPSTSSTSSGPKAPCTNPDGTPAQAVTPGSIIHEYTTKAVVGAGIDSIVSAQELDDALGAIANALIGQVLGGVGGLFGASQPSASTGRSLTDTLTASSTAGSGSVGASALSFAKSVVAQLAGYISSWGIIQSSAQAASTNVQKLASACSNLASDTQTALATEITPVLTEAQDAFNTASTTQALALKVEAESSSVTPGSAGALAADTQALSAAPPSLTDIANAKSQSGSAGSRAATSSPSGSLTVSGGTIVDQMTLISKNAQAMVLTCSVPITP